LRKVSPSIAVTGHIPTNGNAFIQPQAPDATDWLETALMAVSNSPGCLQQSRLLDEVIEQAPALNESVGRIEFGHFPTFKHYDSIRV